MMLSVYIVVSIFFSVTCSQVLYSYDSDFGDACERNPCGVNTDCQVRNARVYCLCKPRYKPLPDSSQGCEPECQRNSHCPRNWICQNNECVDPCKNVSCGTNAYCQVRSGYGRCRCSAGYTGDPQTQCTRGGRELFPSNPCDPNPCGGNTQCRVNQGRPTCTCLPGYRGNPRIKCSRGECEINRHCPRHRACVDSYCVDPCYSRCGTGAHCRVRNHIPLCSCPTGTEGDPSVRCGEVNYDPCEPNPCGENTICEADSRRIRCRCADNFIGSPSTRCRYECETDNECALDQMCKDFRCRNPCVDLCGSSAMCTVRNHIGTCTCPTNYQGDPYVRCFPECVQQADCPLNQACVALKCVDPCVGVCGVNANCQVENHVAQCSCPEDHVGNPYVSCNLFTPEDMCKPNPCGLNANCQPGTDREGNDRPVCSCKPGYVGNSLVHCRRGQCVSNNQCPNNRICSNYMCEDPCRGNPCGINAECLADNHGAVCKCISGYEGNAIRQCYRRRTMFRAATLQTMGSGDNETSVDLCTPNPCGVNANCQPGKDQEGNDRPVCSCKPNFTGDSMVECTKFDCASNDDCPIDKRCQNTECVSPCIPDLCGLNADCMVTHHNALCVCPDGYQGDPFVRCRPAMTTTTSISTSEGLCKPNPCGSNADCVQGYDEEGSERPVCSCPPGYTGDPIVRCSSINGECVNVWDCPESQDCTNGTCVDGCGPNACGENTNCTFSLGTLYCDCLEGYERMGSGDCKRPLQDILCDPNPCGANAGCKAGRDSALVFRPLCYCLPGYTGDSTSGCLKKEVCNTDEDCPDNRFCLIDECEDPCKFIGCQNNTECRAEYHEARCVQIY